MEEPPSQNVTSNQDVNKVTRIRNTKILEVWNDDGFQRSCFDSPQSKRS